MAMPSRLTSAAGTLLATATSQRLTKIDATEATSGFKSRRDATLDAAQIRFRRREILLARKQQRHVDRHAGEDRLLDRGQAFLRSRDLDEKVAPPGPRMELARRGERGLRVVREERRDFERYPAVDAVRALEDRQEQVGRLPEVLLRQREEERFAGLALRELRADRRIVGGAALDRLIEDRRIRRESGHRPFVDVAPRACRS